MGCNTAGVLVVALLVFARVDGLPSSIKLRMNPEDTERAVKMLANHLRDGANNVYNDASELSVYYNLKTNETITSMMPRPWYRPGQTLRLPFIGEPCSCSGLQCGCCAGIKIPQLSIDRKACANLTYDPFLFAIVVDVFVDSENVLHNVLSAKNPPPVCIPVVIGGFPTGIDFCIKIFDIHTIGTNVHLCLDFEIRIASAPILVLHFNCIEMGTEGVMLAKPGGDEEVVMEGSETTTQAGEMTFDEVTEMQMPSNAEENGNMEENGMMGENGIMEENGMMGENGIMEENGMMGENGIMEENGSNSLVSDEINETPFSELTMIVTNEMKNVTETETTETYEIDNVTGLDFTTTNNNV